MKKNQKGFTLVELIIAVAILAVVTLAVCGFIVVGSRSYTSANTDIMLQQDAQLALNQISDVIIDTTDSISYGLRSGGSGDMQLVLKDSEFAGEATEKCLVVVNKQESGSVNNNKSYWFYWSKDDETIYFNEVDAASDMDEGDIKSAFEDAAQQDKVYILAQHVQDFSVDISQFEANRVVMLSVLFANGNREYATSNNVTVRNRIALNKITVDPMKRATEFTINAVQSVTLEPGDFFSLADKVTVTSDADNKDLIWEIVGGVQNDTTIVSSSGDLHLGLSETRTNFAVKVSRANEEYAGQNERVAKTIKVNVKRANKVDITGPATAKQGETVDLTGKAVGNLLKQHCDRTECKNTDHIDEDEDLIVAEWTVTAGKDYATILNPTKNSASVEIKTTAPEGSKITVQAASQLADKKGYGPVTGEWTITIEKGKADTVAMPGSFRFGEDNDDILSWLKQGITAGTASEYLVYARVKDPTGRMADRVVLYYTDDGENIRFFPDMFGLVLDRDYKLYLQAILPVPMDVIEDEIEKAPGNRDFSGFVHQYDDVIVDYILKHLDPSSGKYIGTEYDAGVYYEGTISPPFISIKCNNVSYPNNNDVSERYSVNSTDGSVIYSIELNPDGVMNIDAGRSLNGDIHFAIFKGEGDNIENWELVAGYDPDTSRTDLSGGHITQSGSYYFDELGGYLTTSGQSFTNTDMFWLNIQQSGNPLLANNYFNRRTNISDRSACGTYHIVPCFIYANNPNVRGYNFLYRCFDRDGDDVDFSKHLHVQTSAAIKLEVTSGFNLRLPNEGGEERWSEFPLPSDTKFPFVRGFDYLQTITRSFTKYSASGEYKGAYDNIKVDCEYIPATGTQSAYYKIWLYTESDRDGASYTRNVIGVYTWKSGEKEWTPYDLVPHTERVTNETNIEYTKSYNNWAAYFPYPSESGFPFKGMAAGEKQTKQCQLVAYNKSNNYAKQIETFTVECTFDGSTYTIRLVEVANAGTHWNIRTVYGEWKCGANDKKWVLNGGGYPITSDEPIGWDTTVKFEYNGGNYFMELPLPGSARFPKFTGTTYETGLEVYYQESDVCGKDPKYSYGGLLLVYTANADGSYTVQLVNPYAKDWSTGAYTDIKAAWTWSPGQTEWTKIK